MKRYLLKMVLFFVLGLSGVMEANNSSSVAQPYRVSIITSVYKGDLYIEEFMRDITSQTIFDQCELIMINANSPDNEEVVIKRYMEQHPNIVYVKLDNDPGLFGVWNLGIEMARSNYITNANLDDRLKFDCYETHVAYLDSHPEIDLVYSGCYITTIANETFDHNSSNGKTVWHSLQEFDRVKQLYNWIPYVNNHPVWRRSLHERYGLFNESYSATGGMEFWVRCTLCGNAKFKLIKDVYSLYYSNPKGISTNPETRDKIEKVRVINEFKNLYETYFKHIRYIN